MWPLQQRYQAPSTWPRKPNSRPVLAQMRVRGAAGSGFPSGSRSSVAVRVDGPAELVHRPPEVVHGLAVGGA